MNQITSRYKLKITLAVLFSTILFMDSSGMAHDRFSLKFENMNLMFDVRTNMTMYNLRINDGSRSFSTGFSTIGEWDVKKISDSIFNIRFRRWKGYHWQVDLKNREVYRVTKGKFDTLKGKKKIQQHILVNSDSGIPEGFGLIFPSVSADFDAEGEKKFLAQDSEILRIDGWVLTKDGPYAYEIMASGSGVRWKIDLLARKASAFTNRGTEIHYDSGLKIDETDFKAAPSNLAAAGHDEHSQGPQNADLNIPDDITMAGMKAPYPKSEWLESEKEFNCELLKKSSYDVLVVPFQVQGYAIDRVGRSLMARYLTDRISLTTKAKIPDTTLVARALGENDRRYDEKRIYDLADDLKVRVLIRGYVGHNRDEKMRLTFLVQERDGINKLSPETKTVRLNWEDIPFSDTNLPSEAFLKILDKIMSKMPFRTVNSVRVNKYDKAGDIPLPENISSMVASKDTPPVINAFYLQFLGMLYPEQTTAREHVFERSLAALSGISPESPDYPLLKARAYYYLHRRPAALSALGDPSVPEGKAFQAVLNGNLPELEKWTNEIQSPFLKLLSHIDLDDLKTLYGQAVQRETYEKIAKELPDDLAMLTINRMHVDDGWFVLSNLEVKNRMDEVFPVEGFTANDLFTSNAVIGESPSPGDEIDLSVYNHYHRYLLKFGDKICCMNRNGSISEMDYLDLLYAVGESDLLRMVHKQLRTLGLPEDAMNILDKVEAVYRGHPGFTNVRIVTLRKLSEKNHGQARDNMIRRYEESAYNVYLWAQGQTPESANLLGFGDSWPTKQEYLFYEADYPRRYYWPVLKGDRTKYKESFLKDNIYSFIPDSTKNDIQNGQIALQYSCCSMTPLENLKNAFMYIKNLNKDFEKQIDIDIAELLKSNENRFVGHPAYNELFQTAATEKRDIKKELEANISSNPLTWQPYFELGKLYLREGDFKKALVTFQRYPLFRGQNEQNMVEMSNNAHEAGLELFWNSAVDESIPLLKLAANSDTGSGAEMASAQMLALLEGDYQQAAFHSMQIVQRYGGSRYTTSNYSEYLHLFGYHNEAWALFNTGNIESLSPDIWQAVFVGQRMESRSSKEIADWISREGMREVPFEYVARHVFMAFVLDRKLDIGSLTMIKGLNLPDGEGRRKSERFRTMYSEFAEALYHVRQGEFDRAFDLFKKYLFSFHSEIRESALPYLYLSAVKSGRLTELEEHLSNYVSNYTSPGNEFASHLSWAYVSGVKGEHERAMQHLRSASYQIPFTGKRPIFGWYQLVETCEWLYENSKKDEYRAQALRWAKIHQRIKPMFAWAYAVEAKYTDSDTDRVRALAIALYLDEQSERISGFSGPMRDQAIKWLNEHNPFTSEPQPKLSI